MADVLTQLMSSIFLANPKWTLHRSALCRCLIVWLLPVVLSACASRVHLYADLDRQVALNDYDAALATLEAQRDAFGHRNQVLFYLEKGLLQHYAGRYGDSTTSLEKAELLMEALYTRSVSQEAATFVANDNVRDYRGEDFESALVNLFMALNYALQDNYEDALVEARKVDLKLNSFNDQYPEDQKNVYQEDGFIRFLMGVFYEAEGLTNDAFIEWRNADAIYHDQYALNYGLQAPDFLGAKLLASARRMGFSEEAAQIESAYPHLVANESAAGQLSEIYLIHYNGPGARKAEARFPVVMPDHFVLQITYPEFVRRPFRIQSSRLELSAIDSGRQYEFESQAMEDVAGIAELNLANRIDRIKIKTMARVTAKYLAAKAIENEMRKKNKKNGMGLLLTRLVTQTALLASEQADIRQWRLLPSQIRVAYGRLPAGDYQGRIAFLDDRGAVVSTRRLPPFFLKAGGKKLVLSHTVD